MEVYELVVVKHKVALMEEDVYAAAAMVDELVSLDLEGEPSEVKLVETDVAVAASAIDGEETAICMKAI